LDLLRCGEGLLLILQSVTRRNLDDLDASSRHVRGPRVERNSTASVSFTTSAYFASMSNRFARWGSGWRSPQASAITAVRKPCDIASTHVARTQPLVETPVSSTLSMPSAVSVEASDVPKKALGYCFEMTSSSERGSSPFAQSPIGSPWRK